MPKTDINLDGIKPDDIKLNNMSQAGQRIQLANRAILHIDEAKCNGCGKCLPSCAEGALKIERGKVKIIADKLCDGLGACLGACPHGALRIEERAAEPFDEGAVHAAQNGVLHKLGPTLPRKGKGQSQGDKNWPLKLQLIQAQAEFIQQSAWVLVADCAPLACQNFAHRYLAGRPGLLCCPKLEDKQAIVDKLSMLLMQCRPSSILVTRMEVPCCCLDDLLKKAVAAAKTSTPVTTSIISRFGLEKLPGLSLAN